TAIANPMLTNRRPRPSRGWPSRSQRKSAGKTGAPDLTSGERRLLHHGVAATLQRHPGIERRIAVLWLQHHHDGADANAVIKIDDVLVGHADAALGDRFANI